uniref:Uncharacterized protein n=1 Tax=Arundo donax TaxID=35708 RepID=A0A0A8ZQF4_ARUDO
MIWAIDLYKSNSSALLDSPPPTGGRPPSVPPRRRPQEVARHRFPRSGISGRIRGRWILTREKEEGPVVPVAVRRRIPDDEGGRGAAARYRNPDNEGCRGAAAAASTAAPATATAAAPSRR